MVVVLALTLGALGFVVFSMVRSIQNEHTPGISRWREFGLGLALMVLFFGSWIGHGIAEWQVYTDEARELGQPTEAGDFLAMFAQATLENWQSEFLQLFAFVTLAALYVHKGSAESKDGEERLEASLRRIEEHLGTLPGDAPDDGDSWRLPETPLKESS
jgi:hypothetical protein